MELGGARTPR